MQYVNPYMANPYMQQAIIPPVMQQMLQQQQAQQVQQQPAVRVSGRSGYGGGSMGHTDPMQVIHDMLATANPEMRAKIRNEIMGM